MSVVPDMPAQRASCVDAVVVSPVRQPTQHASTPYGKVAAWLNSSYNSPAAKAGSGTPLFMRLSSSLLWYVGLGGALQHKHRAAMQSQPQQQQQQAQPAQAAPADIAGAPAAAGEGLETAAGRGGGPAHSSMYPGRHTLPLSQPSILQSVTSGPGSHPLTLQQIEQSMEFSTSSSSASPGTAPVQAVTKGTWGVDCQLVLLMLLAPRLHLPPQAMLAAAAGATAAAHHLRPMKWMLHTGTLIPSTHVAHWQHAITHLFSAAAME